MLALAAIALAACAPEVETPLGAAPGADRVAAAVASASRPEKDRADDAMRKPAAVLSFIGIEPGMTVFEVEAGRGYYTELYAPLARPEGVIIMQNPASFDSFLANPVAKRLADNRLPNVRLSKSPFDALDADDGSVDIATWLLGPHDLYYTPPDGVDSGDPETAFAEVFRILKPGGLFVILDHAALPGAPSTTGGTLHRIDPAIVKGLAAGAGFLLIEENDVLRNPDDDYTMSVFDPAIRRRTDRFLLKYKKPE